MSRSVPFEDPLLHPPSPPVGPETTSAGAKKQPEPVKSPLAGQVDDGPIPFFSSADTPSTFTPPPFKPQTSRAAATPSPQPPAAVDTVTSPTALGPKSTPAQPDFVDPLSAASSNDDLTNNNTSTGSLNKGGSNNPKRNSARLTSPSIGIPATNNSMPTEFPTHLASPPLPQRPPTVGSTTFSAFQAFSTALNPSITAGTPVSATGSGSGTPTLGGTSDLILDRHSAEHSQQQHHQHQSQPSFGLGLDHPQTPTPSAHEAPLPPPPPAEPWPKRHSIGVSTNPSGISFQDQGDMVRQELRSPGHETAALNTPRSPPYEGSQAGNRPLHIRPPGDQPRDHSSASFRSPGFAIPQSPMRKEGFPVLNAHNMFHEITMTDAMNDLMIKHIPADQRVLRDWNGLTEAEQRQASRSEILHELTINNSWRAMTRYTRSQILMTPSDHILELINLWYARLLALVKLGQYEMAQAELDQLGDLHGPQFRYENYAPDSFAVQGVQSIEQPNNTIRRGCMVPFEMFVLRARLQGYLGDTYEAIDQLYELIMRSKKFEAICQVAGDSVGIKQWQDIAGQLHLMVLNYLVELKDYPAATKHARDLSRKYPRDINFQSGLGRLYLQLGDLVRAEEVFKEVETMVKNHRSEAEQVHFRLQLTMNRALLAVTQGQWLAAKAAFEEVLAQEPENLAATNNLAVCELYAGQLNEAIPRVEKLMFAYPTSAGTSEPLVFNMATLYELRTEGSFRKKQQVMMEVSKWAGDQFNVAMFKI
ncbi:Trafficking protein particle complex subunit 12 [Linnemannia schmuckeri]|uniref:Trafficking protein particle complex subunit 12 n=1 Tax=Linnemannia schmuckeri TaxID=64567 RepID=A0A9P5VEL6_9FUNG|nr:Trafficking protein particle complex subunit 12 [Linnemannia schmuckeri]